MSYVPPIEREIKDFYRDHVDALYRSCCFLTGGQGDAEAMVRTVFHRLLAKGMEFTSDRDARAWMILEACKLAKHPAKLMPSSLPELPPEQPSAAEPEVPAPQPESREEAVVSPEEPAEEAFPQETEPAREEAAPAASEESAALPQEAQNPEEEPLEIPPEETLQPEALPQEEPQEIPQAKAQEAPAQRADVFCEIRKLSYKNRLVALLYYCEGYRKAEIANYLGCPEFQVRARLRKVAKLIQDDVGGEEEC